MRGRWDTARFRLEINKRKACFSEAEISFFKDAVAEGHVSQTHFTDPRLEYCYRCPLCNRVINGENLSQSMRKTLCSGSSKIGAEILQ